MKDELQIEGVRAPHSGALTVSGGTAVGAATAAAQGLPLTPMQLQVSFGLIFGLFL